MKLMLFFFIIGCFIAFSIYATFKLILVLLDGAKKEFEYRINYLEPSKNSKERDEKNFKKLLKDGVSEIDALELISYYKLNNKDQVLLNSRKANKEEIHYYLKKQYKS